MIKIRYPRLAKFRKKSQKLKLAAQIVAIWYIGFFSLGYLTSNTAAYFTSNDEKSVNIQAGYWDESKLDFIKKGNDNLNEFICPTSEFEISTVIKNIGKTDMFREGTYEVYFIANGQPSVNGSKVAEGNISKLLAGQELVLTQKVTSEGFYMFKAFEDSGQNNEKEIWSEKIKVKCKTSNSPKNEVGEVDTTEIEAVEPLNPSENDLPKEDSKVEQSIEETTNQESKPEPGAGPEYSDPNNSNQNNTENENNNASKVKEEEQIDNEIQNN
jgi:YqxM protein